MENKEGAQLNILHVQIHLVTSHSPVFVLPFDILSTLRNGCQN